MLEFKQVSIKELPQIADAIIEQSKQVNIFLFEGEMGAGKTTLISTILKKMGSKDEVSSPTFALVNNYETPAGLVYHFDLYRIKNLEEALNIGIEEYLESGNICFIEWHGVIQNLLGEACIIQIEKLDGDLRNFRIFKF